jgi:hypothetical protein
MKNQNNDREEFYRRFGVNDDWDSSLFQLTPSGYVNVSDKVWSYFQSKHLEKIERVKKLKRQFKKDVDYGVYREDYLSAISDVLRIIEE